MLILKYLMRFIYFVVALSLLVSCIMTDSTWLGELEKEDSCTTVTVTVKSLQSCPTLCDRRDGSPPDFPVPEILQARTLE